MALTFEASQAEYEELDCPPEDTEAWHEMRRAWINTSNLGALFGEHPYQTLGDICTEKLAGRKRESDAKLVTYARGHRWEKHISEDLEADFGFKLYKPDVMFRRGPLLSNPDRLDRNREELVVELKTAREYLGPVIPRHWWWQVQGEMWCCDASMAIVGALDSSLDVRIFEVDRDDDAIHKAVTRAQELLDALEWGDMPSGVQLSADNVSQLWPKDSGAKREVDPVVLDWEAEYLHQRDVAKSAEAEKKRLKDLIVARIGSDSIGTLGGEELFTYRASKDRLVTDWQTLAAEHPEIVERYTTTVPGPRSFRTKDKAVRAMTQRENDGSDF